MANFYTEIATHYDQIFPLSQATLRFLLECIIGSDRKKVLDVACGSGTYAIAMQEAGHQVCAIDLNATMIEALHLKNPTIDAQILDMLALSSLNQTFDLIYCIGNSLVHLDNQSEVIEFLKTSLGMLYPNGKLVLQIINYDRILDQQVDHLPTVANHEHRLSFERKYHYGKERHKIDFHSILRIDEDTIEHHVMLLPIRSSELLDALHDIGCHKVSLYGSFAKDVFDPIKSIPLIVVIEK